MSNGKRQENSETNGKTKLSLSDQTNSELDQFQFEHVSTVYDSAVDRLEKYRNGLIRPLHIGYSRLTNALGGGVYDSTIYVIGGRPGSGKSILCNRLLFNICDCNDDQDYIILYWNFEMPNWQQIFREISAKQGYTMDDLRSSNQKLALEEMIKIKSMKELFSNYPLYFNNTPRTPEYIYNAVSKLAKSKKKNNPNAKIINILDHSRLITNNNRITEEERITKLFAVSHQLKIDWGVTSIILSQLNRNIENEKRISNVGPVPQGSDFFGADSVQQYANVGIILQVPEMYQIGSYMGIPRAVFEDKSFLHIVKNRDGALGWIPYHRRYSNYQIDEISKEDWKEMVNSV